jgi:uncharacterized membrane protein YraQ (UPF0718 family)
MHVRLRRIPSPRELVLRAGPPAVFCVLCATTPAESPQLLAALADWASVVAAALPYVVFGFLAAALLNRLRARGFARGHLAVGILAICNPGCDCALNGFADALSRADPALAGFVLTFAAIASPAALAVTFAALGSRMTLIRLFGAAVAAALTALVWRVMPARVSQHRHACGVEADPPQLLASALIGVLCAAAAAAAGKQLLPAQFFSHVSAFVVAAMGALLSPCSTADPFMAASLLRDARDQAAFVVAAQGASVRQLALLARGFGIARAIAAIACCAVACTAAVAFA